MEIFKVFRKPMSEANQQKELNEKLSRQEQSLNRRDRRINDLKKRLRNERNNSLAAELKQAREIIAGLEQALLMHTPTTVDARDRIAKLEEQLLAMTDLLEMHFSTPLEPASQDTTNP